MLSTRRLRQKWQRSRNHKRRFDHLKQLLVGEQLEVRAAPGSMLVVALPTPFDTDDLAALQSRHTGVWAMNHSTGQSQRVRPWERLATVPTQAAERTDIADPSRVASESFPRPPEETRRLASETRNGTWETGLEQAFFMLEGEVLQPLYPDAAVAGGDGQHVTWPSKPGDSASGSSNSLTDSAPSALAAMNVAPPQLANRVTSTSLVSPFSWQGPGGVHSVDSPSAAPQQPPGPQGFVDPGETADPGNLPTFPDSGAQLPVTTELPAANRAQTIAKLGFDEGFAGWTIQEWGGSEASRGTVTHGSAVLNEGDSFLVGVQRTFAIPTDAASLVITYRASFDGTSTDTINDAFEVALVDEAGQPLVHTIGPGKDAFFNDTEVGGTLGGSNTTIEQQADFTKVTVDLSSVFAGEVATLVFRLINNDADQQSTVHIEGAELQVNGSFCTWQNPANHLDTNADKFLSPIDALLPINKLNRDGTTTVPDLFSAATPPPYFDVSCDGFISPIDALLVINYLNLYGSGEAERSSPGDLGAELPSSDMTKFFVVDAGTDVTYRYGPVGGVLGSAPLAGQHDPRGTTSTAAGDIYWTIDGTSHQVAVFLADGQRLGAWQALDLTRPEGLATDGRDLWVVEAGRMARYQKAAIRTDGEQAASEAFELDEDNVDPTGLATDGTTLWVTDATADAVFVYDVSGQLRGVWQLDARNSAPSGITNEPGGGSDLWVVDREDRVVYQYAAGASQIDGRAIAAGSFALGKDNRQPEGIADPPTIVVTSPVDPTSLAAGSTVLIVGRASAPVDLNGTPVEVYDAAGNFFSQVHVGPGENQFTLTATDDVGETASESLTLTGTQLASGQLDFSHFSDVSASFQAEYARTSFNEDTKLLYVDIGVRNAGQYEVNVPLYVAVQNISDPSVRVRDAVGTTPDGVPFLDFTSLVSNGRLSPTDLTGTASLAFYNPERIQFTYDLAFLGVLNRAPAITSVPDVEALTDHAYVYEVESGDADGDPPKFSLVNAPTDMVIDTDTGRITWSPGNSDVGTHVVAVRVEDGRGRAAEQRFVLSTIEPPPNRPPVFTSMPIVSASVNTSYTYQATAADPDDDALTFSVRSGPANMTVDPTTGSVEWTPNIGQIGLQDITLSVSDGRGGTATQMYAVRVGEVPGNHPPVIVSAPVTQFNLGPPTAPAQPINLLPWTVVQYEFNAQPDANWQLSENNTVATQSVNADASILLSDFSSLNDRIEGTWRVTDAGGDDDFIGFVFGYQDSQHFYLFDWKQVTQDAVLQGMSVKVVNAPSPVTSELWSTAGNGDRVRTIYHNNVPWAAAIDYQFELEFHAGAFSIAVRQGNTLLASVALFDDTFTSGAFGFYNYSQANVRYSGFTRQQLLPRTYVYPVQAVDSDGDPLSYVLSTQPAGMTIDPVSGLISWPALASSSGTIQIDPRSTYLHTSGDAGARASAPIDLASIGIRGGDYVRLEELGDFAGTSTAADQNRNMLGVFSSSSMLLASSLRHRVPGAINAGTDTISAATFIGTEPTDIPEDFKINTADVGGTVVQIPDLAKYLFVGPPDSFWGDNRDPDNDYSVRLTRLPFYGVTVRVEDGHGGSDTQTFEIELTRVAPGEIRGTTFADLDRSGNRDVVEPGLSGWLIFLDQNGNGRLDPVERSATTDTGGNYSFLDLAPGNYTVALEGQHGSEQTAPAGSTHLVILAGGEIAGDRDFGVVTLTDVANRPPSIIGDAPAQAISGTAYRYQPDTSDPDGDSLTFDLPVKPTGMVVDPVTGVVGWVPTREQLGAQDVILRVQDGRGGLDLQSFRVTAALPNTAPAITSTPPGPAFVNSPYQYSVRAQDADGDPLSFHLTTGPAGMAVDPVSGILSWTPTSSQLGSALTFDGVDDNVLIPDSPSLTPSSITLEAWVNPDTVSADASGRAVLTKYNSNSPTINGVSWSLTMLDTGRLRFSVYQNVSGNVFRAVDTNASALAPGAWQHVAATFDLATQQMKIYVNGAQVASTVRPEHRRSRVLPTATPPYASERTRTQRAVWSAYGRVRLTRSDFGAWHGRRRRSPRPGTRRWRPTPQAWSATGGWTRAPAPRLPT